MFPISRLFGRIRVFQVYSRGKKSKAGKNKPQSQSQPQTPSHPQTVEVPQIKVPETNLKLSNANAVVDANPSFWKRNAELITGVSTVTGIVAAIGTIVAYPEAAYRVFIGALAKIFPVTVLPWSLEVAKVECEVLKEKYIKREKMEGVIRTAMKSSVDDRFYYIVFGAKGVGKSTLVDHVASEGKAVVKVTLSSVDTMATVTAKFMKSVTGREVSFDREEMKRHMKAFHAKHEGKIIPTVIFEVERARESTDFKNVLKQISSLSKELYMYCNCIIVVSEANAVFQFDSDRRQKFIFVEEMTKEEARAYLELKGLTFEDAKQMDELYETIGGNVSVLDDFRVLRNTYSFDESLTQVVKSVVHDLKAFKVKPILQALKEHPEGVNSDDFKEQKYEGIDLSDYKSVGNAMKDYNAIVYRMDMRPPVYQPLSTCHKTALKSYVPKSDKTSLLVPEPSINLSPPPKAKPWYWPW